MSRSLGRSLSRCFAALNLRDLRAETNGPATTAGPANMGASSNGTKSSIERKAKGE